MAADIMPTVNHPHVRQGEALSEILRLLHRRIGYDFSQYKRGTISRRTVRRMGLRHICSMKEYLEYLSENPGEVEALCKDLLIGVTRFFREPEAWATLAREALPEIVARAGETGSIRAWVPGCATGEEVYTLAMLLLEAAEATRDGLAIQIFASDIAEESLEIARRGRYPETIACDISPQRLRRFFHELRGEPRYRVSKQLREMVIFARQNLISDPPFSKLDIISCRNVLIYLDQALQNEMLRRSHFALKPNGYLFLGTAESVGEERGLFETVSKKWRIFRKLELKNGEGMIFPKRGPAAVMGHHFE